MLEEVGMGNLARVIYANGATIAAVAYIIGCAAFIYGSFLKDKENGTDD